MTHILVNPYIRFRYIIYIFGQAIMLYINNIENFIFCGLKHLYKFLIIEFCCTL